LRRCRWFAAGSRSTPRRPDPQERQSPAVRAFARCAEEDSNLHPVTPDEALNLVTRVPYPSRSRTLRSRSPASPATSTPASCSRRTIAALRSPEPAATTTRTPVMKCWAVRGRVQVQHEIHRGLRARRLAGLAPGGVLERDAEDRGPEAARLCGGRGADLPPGRGQTLGDRALGSGVHPPESFRARGTPIPPARGRAPRSPRSSAERANAVRCARRRARRISGCAWRRLPVRPAPPPAARRGTLPRRTAPPCCRSST
jgi:hypothetical protein